LVRCHDGHEIGDEQYGLFYCDCGASGSCQCLDQPWRQQQDDHRTMLLLAQAEDLPFPDPEGLTLLTSMGFSPRRARKALLLNLFEYQQSLDWLLAHSNDDDIDDPLTEAQVMRIMGTYNRSDDNAPRINNNALPPAPQAQAPTQAQPPQSRAEALQNAVRNNICTFKATGKNFELQNWYHCYTCGLVDNEGCCESCAAVCHAGHTLSEMKSSSHFYCDCGNNAAAHNCKCCK